LPRVVQILYTSEMNQAFDSAD